MKLLYAEDEAAMAEAVTDILTYHHYLVDGVADGEEALAYARAETYDGIILDVMMPKVDGLTVLETLRREGCRTPILLLTAKGEVEDRIRGLDLGADDYLPKPFAMGELLAQLLSILLDNGVKYTDPGGAIRLTLTGEGKGARLRVENAPARLEGETARLFDRFYRGDPARTQRTGGCGIGLSAAQAIVRAWRGTITAGMEGEDRVVFTVELPGL